MICPTLAVLGVTCSRQCGCAVHMVYSAQSVQVPASTLLSPSESAAVVGGNVLTSQRITDVILSAFEATACSYGCMNNFTFGDEGMGYYETIAGGGGAGNGFHGCDGVQMHMTNTRITDPEVLERYYPVSLRQFKLRPDSGGAGRWRGGAGVVRELEFLRPLQVPPHLRRHCRHRCLAGHLRASVQHGSVATLPGGACAQGCSSNCAISTTPHEAAPCRWVCCLSAVRWHRGASAVVGLVRVVPTCSSSKVVVSSALAARHRFTSKLMTGATTPHNLSYNEGI